MTKDKTEVILKDLTIKVNKALDELKEIRKYLSGLVNAAQNLTKKEMHETVEKLWKP